jgi:hypothetical protein
MNWLIPRAICLPRLLLAILTVALLAGCATSGPTYSEASSAESVGGLTCFPGMRATVIACFEIQH